MTCHVRRRLETHCLCRRLLRLHRQRQQTAERAGNQHLSTGHVFLQISFEVRALAGPAFRGSQSLPRAAPPT